MVAMVSDELRYFDIFEITERNSTKFDRKQLRSQRPLPSKCVSDRSENQDGRTVL